MQALDIALYELVYHVRSCRLCWLEEDIFLIDIEMHIHFAIYILDDYISKYYCHVNGIETIAQLKTFINIS